MGNTAEGTQQDCGCALRDPWHKLVRDFPGHQASTPFPQVYVNIPGETGQHLAPEQPCIQVGVDSGQNRGSEPQVCRLWQWREGTSKAALQEGGLQGPQGFLWG